MKTNPPSPNPASAREPTSFWIWAAFFLLTSLSVPFLFAGRVEPLVLDIPLWFLLSLFCYLLMAVLIVYLILRRWSLAGPILGEEE